jgi:hypothetical protein
MWEDPVQAKVIGSKWKSKQILILEVALTKRHRATTLTDTLDLQSSAGQTRLSEYCHAAGKLRPASIEELYDTEVYVCLQGDKITRVRSEYRSCCRAHVARTDSDADSDAEGYWPEVHASSGCAEPLRMAIRAGFRSVEELTRALEATR